MNSKSIALLLLMLNTVGAFAQSQPKVDSLVQKGNRYLQSEDLNSAFSAYQEAYSLSKGTDFEAALGRMRVWAVWGLPTPIMNAIPNEWALATAKQKTAMIAVLATLYSNTLDLKLANYWLSRLRSRHDMKYLQTEKDLTERLAKENAGYQALLHSRQYSFLKHKESVSTYEFKFLVKSLLSPETYRMPLFPGATVNNLLSSIGYVEEWRVTKSDVVVVRGWEPHSAGIRGLLLFDLKRKRGIFLLWIVSQDLFIFGNDHGLLTMPATRAIVDEWKRRIIKSWQGNATHYDTFDLAGL